MQQSRKRARDLLGKMAPRASQHDGGGESEARRAPGCIEVGAVGQDVPGWCEVYIGRTRHWRDLPRTEKVRVRYLLESSNAHTLSCWRSVDFATLLMFGEK